MSYRYRLTPTPEHEAALLEHCAHARFVWNLAVEQQSWWRPGRGSAPGATARCVSSLKRARPSRGCAAGSSSVQQQALRDFDRAMAAFFDPQNPAGKPSFRSKRGPQGFVIRDTKVRRLNRRGVVFVPKCGYVRFRLDARSPGEAGHGPGHLDRAAAGTCRSPPRSLRLTASRPALSSGSTAVSARPW